MSRLVGYGTGEVVDRLTILELKILHGRAVGKDVLHFEEEWSALQERLRQELLMDRNLYFHKALRLAVVNAALWAATDEMRAYGWYSDNSPGWTPVGKCAMRMQQLNYQRAELVAEINALTGAPAPAEKL